MSPYKNILSALLCGAIACAPALANNCDNPQYRRYNPDKCAPARSFSFATTALTATGGAAILGGVVALLGGTSSGGGSSHTNTVSATLPTYTHVGADVDEIQLASITGTAEYNRNNNSYNDIRLAYSLARGYTGAGSTIAVMDGGENSFHGTTVAQFASGEIAPNATVQSYQIRDDNGKFLTYSQIGDIIASARGANIYNFSWNATNLGANDIVSRAQMERITSTDFITSITTAARDDDAIFVIAAGNNGRTQSGAFSALPAVIPELSGHVVNVVAWDSTTGALADYSNTCGVTQDWCITAPGTELDTGRTLVSGTSFAAPVVSAAIAVIREAFPYMSSEQITDLLFTTARDLGDVGVDEVYGHGMLDLERATRPVGTELVMISDTVSVRRATARVSAPVAQSIKSANIKFAFVDGYGRAFNADLGDNISVKNRGIGFERLRENRTNKITFGNLEMGFKHSDLLRGDGFMRTESDNLMTFMGYNGNFNIGHTTISTHTTFGAINPTPAPDSMINGFSNIYTASAAISAQYGNLSFGIGIPDTIIDGNMSLNIPTGRDFNGNYTFANYTLDLATRPSMEYTASYKSITAGFVDNPYGTDEVYILTRGTIKF